MTLPEQIDVSNAGQIREELLVVINRGAAALIADMTATLSCDHAGADAVVRAYQRALVSGTQLRLVVTAPIVQRVLGINGLDRLIPIYPTLEAAIAGGTPAPVPPAAPRAADPLNQPGTAAITMAVLEELIDALADGVAVTDDAGTLTLANRRLEEMFGYEHTELIGQPVESLIPAGLRAAHRSHRAAYARAPEARPMGAGARLVGLRKDGATFPVEISLSPVPTTTGLFALAVVRDITQTRQREDPANIARTAATAKLVRPDQELLHRTTHIHGAHAAHPVKQVKVQRADRASCTDHYHRDRCDKISGRSLYVPPAAAPWLASLLSKHSGLLAIFGRYVNNRQEPLWLTPLPFGATQPGTNLAASISWAPRPGFHIHPMHNRLAHLCGSVRNGPSGN